MTQAIIEKFLHEIRSGLAQMPEIHPYYDAPGGFYCALDAELGSAPYPIESESDVQRLIAAGAKDCR